MTTKRRLSVSVDPALVEAGERAVATGEAESLSAWVSEALAVKVAHSARLRALAEYIEFYEAEFGVITEEEMEAEKRRRKERAVVIRGKSSRPRRKGVA